MGDALTGTDGMSIYSMLVVGAAVVVLVGLFIWHLRRRGHMAFIRGGTNRQPRLAVLDAAAVDARRRLVLVRRDNVEHLIMIGGPSDIVVESGISRPATAVRPGQQDIVRADQQDAVALRQPPMPAPAAPPTEQQRPPQPKSPPPPKPRSEPIATEPLNIPVSKPAEPPEAPKKADASPADRKPAVQAPPPAAEPRPAPPPVAETRPSPPRREPQEAPAPELAAVAVSAAAVAAADEAAIADEAAVKDAENAITAELEDVLDAARDLVMPDKQAEAELAPESVPAPTVDISDRPAEIPAVETVTPSEQTAPEPPHSVTADELIADFDKVLEAEMHKAEQQKAKKEPEAGEPSEPKDETEDKSASASLEDEMKKLLGDLSIKQ